ncbi:uncharacterized protein BcabD6B2_04870 [Babesia caballi]|uniref:Uncharacterized protein n=1 Tax=Babesia caballi TaxID=5871 RepID=A0AAV4LMP7_BABCB|nr:hypothetical protein BcabD6B2_04870 [Babesia caballi]
MSRREQLGSLAAEMSGAQKTPTYERVHGHQRLRDEAALEEGADVVPERGGVRVGDGVERQPLAFFMPQEKGKEQKLDAHPEAERQHVMQQDELLAPAGAALEAAGLGGLLAAETLALLVLALEGVLVELVGNANGQVEDAVRVGGVGVLGEVAQALEVDGIADVEGEGAALAQAVVVDAHGVVVEVLDPVALLDDALLGVGLGEEPGVPPHLDAIGVPLVEPVDRGLDLAAVGRRAPAAGGGVVRADELLHFVAILDDGGALHPVAVTQPHLVAHVEPVEVLGGLLHEVPAVDVEALAEGELAGAGAGEVGHLDLLLEVLGEGLDLDEDGVHHGEEARGALVHDLADAILEQLDLDEVLALGDPDLAAEAADGGGGAAAAPQAGDGGHAGVVPAAHEALLDELDEQALVHDAVGQVEARVLDLAGAENTQLLLEPVVERPVVLELDGADGVGDALYAVRLAVGVVVHGVDDPLVAGVDVGRANNAIQDWVTHVHVARRHVDLSAQQAVAVGEGAVAHLLEEVEVLLHAAVAVGRLASGLGDAAARLADLLDALVVHVGQALLDELDGPVVQLLEVVGGEVEVLAPVVAQPAHVVLDGLNVHGLLGGRVGVVEAHVRAPAEHLRELEVEADGLGVADVQVTVGLGREARDDLLDATLGHVALHDLVDEVGAVAIFRRVLGAARGVTRQRGIRRYGAHFSVLKRKTMKGNATASCEKIAELCAHWVPLGVLE